MLMTLTIERGPGLLRREKFCLHIQTGKINLSGVMSLQIVLNDLLHAESEKDVMTSDTQYRWPAVLAAARFALFHCSLCLSPPSCFGSKSGAAGSCTTPPQELFYSCSQQAPLAARLFSSSTTPLQNLTVQRNKETAFVLAAVQLQP